MKNTYLILIASALLLACGENDTEQSIQDVASNIATEELTEAPNENINQTIPEIEILVDFDLKKLSQADFNAFAKVQEFDSVNYVTNQAVLSQQSVNFVSHHFLNNLNSTGYNEWSFVQPTDHIRLNYWEYYRTALPTDLVEDYIYSGYIETDEDDELFAKGLFALVRSQRNINNIWMVAKSTLFNTINNNDYHTKGYAKYVDGLLETYDFILSKGEPNLMFDRIERRISELEYTSTGDLLDIYGPFVPESVYRNFGNVYTQNHDVIMGVEANNTTSSWFASFWYRRNRENNMNSIKTILTEIQAHYGKSNANVKTFAKCGIETIDDLGVAYVKFADSCVCNGTSMSRFEFEGYYFNDIKDTLFRKLIVKHAGDSYSEDEMEKNNVFYANTDEFIGSLKGNAKAFFKSVEEYNLEDDVDTYYDHSANNQISVTGNGMIQFNFSGSSYTGGAHGSWYSSYMTYVCELNDFIVWDDYIINKDKLLAKIKTKLREDTNVPDDKTLEDWGFWEIYVTNNIAISDNKISFQYGLYDICPYSGGAPEVTFLKSEVQEFFKIKI